MTLDAGTVWGLSRAAHRRGWRRLSRLLKGVNFVLFHCVLPGEVDVRGQVVLLHRGLGVVVHPDVRLEGQVVIAHNVTLGVADYDRSLPAPRLVVEDGVFIGAGAVVLVRTGQHLRVGRSAVIGAGAVVVGDVRAGQRVAGPKATAARTVEEGSP